jgi:rhodanese-related sulfurtransferase
MRRDLMDEVPRITAQELKQKMDTGEALTVIDVRNPEAWAQSDTMIPDAIRVPLDQLDRSLLRIPREGTIVAYCT